MSADHFSPQELVRAGAVGVACALAVRLGAGAPPLWCTVLLGLVATATAALVVEWWIGPGTVEIDPPPPHERRAALHGAGRPPNPRPPTEAVIPMMPTVRRLPPPPPPPPRRVDLDRFRRMAAAAAGGRREPLRQCPACASFGVEVAGRGAFGCGRCGSSWRWRPGEPWPITSVDPAATLPT